ncbi:hypothetical protein Tco_0163802 [Tanacetum coccineum]
MKLTTGRLVNGSFCGRIDMVIKDLDLKPKINAMMRDFLEYGTNALSKFSPDTELVLYPLQDKLTSGDKSLDLSAFKLSRLFFSLLSSGSSSCWRSYGAQ